MTSSANSSETDQVDHQQETIIIVDDQQETRIPADNQGEKANDEAPSIVHRPTDLTQINGLQQIGEVGELASVCLLPLLILIILYSQIPVLWHIFWPYTSH